MKTYSLALKSLAATLPLVVVLMASGCGKAQKPDEGAIPNAPSADDNVMGDSDSGRAMGLQTVNFQYDSFTLTKESKNILSSNAEILKGKPGVKIQVEGHCDSHGGIQYNIALGEKRANATKKYLQDMGIESDRITTISYGKERLLDQGTSEAAHAKNRRANFVITSR
jgi:peptidoglycan-associated lipoprotein